MHVLDCSIDPCDSIYNKPIAQWDVLFVWCRNQRLSVFWITLIKNKADMLNVVVLNKEYCDQFVV